MFFSDEPGFYKDGEYGIRIETVLRVVNVDFQDETYGKFLGFEPVMLVPFEPKLIDFSMMSPGQVSMEINLLFSSYAGFSTIKANFQASIAQV